MKYYKARKMAELHARVLAVIATVHKGTDVVELSVREHMLLLSLVDAFERGARDEVYDLVQALPAWLREQLGTRAYCRRAIIEVVDAVRSRAMEIGAQIGGAA